MCGIVGFIGQGERDDLEKMSKSLVHRGPDDEGIFFENEVALGHRRLSIIDLTSAGHQPMFSNDKSIGIVFNGEIYNFQDLKDELVKEGFSFVSKSDTEVIIALYKKYGVSCFEKMNGMFAIAIYDFENRKLVLSRDRLGKKPLYWALFGETLIFASELKAIMAHPLCVKEIDSVSLQLYLSLDYVPTPRSILKNVYKLEPGSYLVYQDLKVTKGTFWKMKFQGSQLNIHEALLELDKKINESVKGRLISDVPLGIFLSGGLDSSTIAYYAKLNSKEKIHTFSVGFSEKSFDESRYALAISKYLNTEHHHINLSAKDSLNLIPDIADILDEPMADASIIPTYLLSRFTKENVTVALGGDGGDELFAGYPTFQADKFLTFYNLLPDIVKEFIRLIINFLPVSEANFSVSFKIRKFIEGACSDRLLTHQNWLGTFSSEDVSKLLKEKQSVAVPNWINDVLKSFQTDSSSNEILGMYMKTYLMDEVMVKVDRASMKASLETRSPFLDYKLVDFVNSLPYSFKMRNFTSKYILKKLMRDKLPKDIVYRSKKGFGIPMSKWLKEDLRPLCEGLLSESKIIEQGLFNYTFVRKLLDDHFENKRDNRKEIWNLLVFQLWFNKYV